MAVKSLNVFNPGTGRFRPASNGAVYFIVAEVDETKRVVKIGYSEQVYDRYLSLLTGIPFPSTMHFSWIGSTKRAKWLERHLHEFFRDRRLHRELFRFSSKEMDKVFYSAGIEIVQQLGHAPQWKQITEAQAAEYATAQIALRGKKR